MRDCVREEMIRFRSGQSAGSGSLCCSRNGFQVKVGLCRHHRAVSLARHKKILVVVSFFFLGRPLLLTTAARRWASRAQTTLTLALRCKPDRWAGGQSDVIQRVCRLVPDSPPHACARALERQAGDTGGLQQGERACRGAYTERHKSGQHTGRARSPGRSW